MPPSPSAPRGSWTANARASRRQSNAKRKRPPSPWDTADAFQLSGKRTLALPLLADGESVVAQVSLARAGTQVTVEGAKPAGDAFAVVAGNAAYVLRNGRQTKVTLRDLALEEAGDQGQGGLVRAPMHGKVLAVLVEQGATVARGQRVAIVEAMKMEHTLVAPIDGVVTEIAVAANAQVPEGAKLMLIEAAAAPPSAADAPYILLQLLVHMHAEEDRHRPARQHQRQRVAYRAPRIVVLLRDVGGFLFLFGHLLLVLGLPPEPVKRRWLRRQAAERFFS